MALQAAKKFALSTEWIVPTTTVAIPASEVSHLIQKKKAEGSCYLKSNFPHQKVEAYVRMVTEPCCHRWRSELIKMFILSDPTHDTNS